MLKIQYLLNIYFTYSEILSIIEISRLNLIKITLKTRITFNKRSLGPKLRPVPCVLVSLK